MEYLVTWHIDIDADTPEEAAKRALEIQRNPESIATVFRVQTLDRSTDVTVDLLYGEGTFSWRNSRHSSHP